MNIETRHAHRRRRKLIAAALVTTTLTACAQEAPKPKPLTAGSLDDRDFTRLRAAGGPHVVTPKPQRQAKRRLRRIPVRVNGIPAVWLALVRCEASGDWRYGGPGGHTDPGYSEYEGGPNFVHSTWLAHGGGQYAAHAYDATPAEQIVVAKRTLRSEGVRAWPVCGPRVGLQMSDAA